MINDIEAQLSQTDDIKPVELLKSRLGLHKKQKQEIILKLDDIASWKQEIKQCQENLEDYRAHIVQKFDEAKFDSDFYNDIGTDECIVIWDYKMKILP